MREFMMEAEVGDEMVGEDPSVNQLIEMTCELLGKEAGLFLPSGTMCNQIAMRTHCQPGDEIIADKSSHIRHNEVAGISALSGSLIYPLDGERGIFTADQFKKAIRPYSHFQPRTSLVAIEQTSNSGGGTVWPLPNIEEVCKIALDHKLKRHLDGARLFNAVVKTNTPAIEYTKHFDSVWIDLSKGLGCPLGAVLTGTKEFIYQARRWKHQFGGAMRQAGIVAAAGIYALEHNIDRLEEDHKNATLLAEKLQQIQGIEVEPVETNMVFFDVSGLKMTSQEFNMLLEPHGLRFSDADKYRLRAVTHLDISRDQILEAIDIIHKCI
jgi:threonine aldolase